jgi:Polyketide cyclase / dehydrase and lipid transport
MARVTADIDIEGTPREIMDVIADLPGYPRWSAVHKRASVQERYDDGRPRRATMAVTAAGLTDEQVLDYRWGKGGTTVEWSLVKAGQQADQHGSYVIDRAGKGVCHVHYDLDIKPAIPFPAIVVRRVMKKAVTAATQGLKSRVESRA